MASAIAGKLAGTIAKHSSELSSLATGFASKHGSEIMSAAGKAASDSKNALTSASSGASSVAEKAGEIYEKHKDTIGQIGQIISSTQGAKQGSNTTESVDNPVQNVGSQLGNSIKGVYHSIFPSKLDEVSASEAAGDALIQRICDEIARNPGIVNLISNSLKRYLEPKNADNKLAGKKLNQAMYHIIDKFLEHLLVNDYAEQKLVLILLENNRKDFRQIFTAAIVYNNTDEIHKPKITSTNSRKISHQIIENLKKLLKKITNGQSGGDGNKMTQQIINKLDYDFRLNTDTAVTNSEILKTILKSLEKHMNSPEFGQKVQPILIDAINQLFKTFVTSISGFDLAKYIMWGILQNSTSVRNVCFDAVDKVVQEAMTTNSPELDSNHANSMIDGFVNSLKVNIALNDSSLAVETSQGTNESLHLSDVETPKATLPFNSFEMGKGVKQPILMPSTRAGKVGGSRRTLKQQSKKHRKTINKN